jgi:hypothetical protein
MTAMRVRLAQTGPAVFHSRIVCDKPGCIEHAESRYGAVQAHRYAKEAGWRVNIKGGRRPMDLCPKHREGVSENG